MLYKSWKKYRQDIGIMCSIIMVMAALASLGMQMNSQKLPDDSKIITKVQVEARK